MGVWEMRVMIKNWGQTGRRGVLRGLNFVLCRCVWRKWQKYLIMRPIVR